MIVPGNNTERISVPPTQRFDHRASELEVRVTAGRFTGQFES
jgi:hypothetical protein